jgi:ectoine hydroxylase-related dioxygenase (phytanoyl-CoA dioxygenase family)
MVLHRDGFTIIKNAVEIHDPELKEIKQQSEKYGRSIFNDNENFSGNDFKRRQNKIKKNSKINNLINKFHNTLSSNFTELEVGDTVVLHSLPGCREQASHMDYIPDKVFAEGPNNQVPLAAILALEPETTINIWPRSIKIASQKKNNMSIKRKKIKKKAKKMSPGDIFVFRGDLIHAGAGYKKHNTRLHCFLDSPLVSREQNITWRVKKDPKLSEIIE